MRDRESDKSPKNAQQQVEEIASVRQGQEAANYELERISHLSDGTQKDQELESLLKKLLGSSVDGMGLEDIAQLSESELNAMLGNSKRKAESRKQVMRGMGKLLTAFNERDADGKNPLFEKLKKVFSLDPGQLKRELSNMPSAKRQQILSVFNAFIPLAIENSRPDFVVPYATFLVKLFKNPDYLLLHSRGDSNRSALEEDLLKFAQIDPRIVHLVIKGAIVGGFDEYQRANQSGGMFLGLRSREEIEARLMEISPALGDTSELRTPEEFGDEEDLLQMLKKDEEKQYNSFETQRIAKLYADVGGTLNAAIDGLFEEGSDITELDARQVTRQELKTELVRFKAGQIDRWSKMNVLLEGESSRLESITRIGREGKRHAERIARLKTLIAARNAFDFLRHSTGVTQGFLPFYERHFLYEIARYKAEKSGNPKQIDIASANLDEYHNPSTFTEKERQLIAGRTASRVRQAATFTVSNIYRNYLSMTEEPTEDFRQALQHGGDSVQNPTEMFRQLTNVVSNLAYQATTVDGGKLDFTVTALGGVQTMYDPNVGREISTHSSERVQKTGKSPHEFLREILAEIKADDGFYEAGHQFRYVTNIGSPDKQRRFFQSVGDLLQHAMTGRNIDRIYSMEDSVYITRAASFIETVLKKRLGEKGWINEGDSKLFQEIFLNKGEGGKSLVLQVQEFLEDNYPDVPKWQRQRIMQHAFTIVFAGRFRYQQIFSYTNPSPGYQGQAEDKQMFNGVFNPFQKAFRFAGKFEHDLWLKGSCWQPLRNMHGFNMPGKWDPFEIGKEGFDVFRDGKHESLGRIAWDLTEHFQDDLPEAFAPVNRLKAGGYDTLRGWRRMADMGVVDKALYDIPTRGGQPNFKAEYEATQADGTKTKRKDGALRLWKSIENIGVNDLQAFVDIDIMSLVKLDAKGDLVAKDGVEQFVRHIYRRYLSDNHEFGKALSHNYLIGGVNSDYEKQKDPFRANTFNARLYGHESRRVQSEDEFWTLFQTQAHKIFQQTPEKDSEDPEYKREKAASKELQKDVLKPMLYDAILVMVAERSPLEFLYRLRGQDEQNGLRLDTQMKKRYYDNRDSSFLTSIRAQDAGLGQKIDGDDEAAAMRIKDKIWDEVTDDMAYVQGELRGEVDDDILKSRSQWEGQTNGLNIYGSNWDQERSSVNVGFGYAMNDETVIRIMIKKFNTGLAQDIKEGRKTAQEALLELENLGNGGGRVLAIRIRRAVQLRKDIIEAMGSDPDVKSDVKGAEAELVEKYLDANGGIKGGLSKEEREAAERFVRNRNKRVNRARWFRRMWDEGFLGSIPFMADNSEIHKVFLNADDAMVYRSTGECGVAERYKLILDARAPEGSDTNMLLMLKDAARKGTPESWGKLKSLITGFRKECSDEIGDGEIFMPVIWGLVKLQLNGLANKQEVRNALGKWFSWTKPEGQSLYSEAWTFFEHHGMDAITIRQYLLTFCKVNGINPKDMGYFATMFQASWFHVGKEVIPEYLTYILAYAFVSYITSAVKENQKK